MPEWMQNPDVRPHRRQWRPPDSRVLVLAANAEGATLEDVVSRYLPGGGGGLRDVQNRRGADLGAYRYHHPVTVCHCCM